MQCSKIVENTQGLIKKDLLLDISESKPQSTQTRREELAQKQLDLETQQDEIKKEISTIEREIK